ncbi:Adaptive-response sensory-kinase SasA [compost metagenome]
MMRDMLNPLRSLWHSVAFRLALNYALLAATTVLVTLTIFYMQTVNELQQASARQITLMLQHLQTQYAIGGRAAVASAITQMLVDGKDSDSEIYLLLDESGRVLAGNLAERPAGLRVSDQPEEHPGSAAGTGPSQLLMRVLPDGASLIVGHDMRDEQRMELLVGQASRAAGLMALLLVVAGTYVFRMTLEQRINAIRGTLGRVGARGITGLPVLPGPVQPDDEFGRLNRDIGQMLDRMAHLMDGVRHVSNTIAHNLRTPLTRILAQLRAAEGDDVPAHLRQEVISSTRRALEDLNIVFEKLLQIAEAESGAGRQGFVPVALNTVVADVVDLYAAVAEERGGSLVFLPGEPLEVAGDPDLLAGAIANLVDNALKYSDQCVDVVLRTQRQGDNAVLTVTDRGPGIPVEDMTRVGTRFYRRDTGLPGYGLGLSSVFAVVQLHHGSYQLSAAAPGSTRPGLAVRIALPLRQA